MKQRTHYKTTNLDLACYLVASGFACSTRRLGPVSAEFVFPDAGSMADIAKKFYVGDCTVKMTAYLYARAALKRELNMKAVEWEKAKPGKVVLNPGQFYYFIAEDGKVYRNVYANREPHVKRIMDGNAFLTLDEANAAARSVKID